MAKKSMDWTFTDTGVLSCEHKDIEPSKTVAFDVTEIFPEFEDLDAIQKNVVVYGLKQKLADSVAANTDMKYTVNERIATMSNTWSRLKDGIWTQKGGPRDSIQKRINENLSKVDLSKVPEEVLAALRASGLKI